MLTLHQVSFMYNLVIIYVSRDYRGLKRPFTKRSLEFNILAISLFKLFYRTDGVVLTTLKSGDFFGEIGILNLEGTANR